ncbi:MAG: hypothetical protein OEY56_06085 [Cyclobacteriaceae bacterium]|nr:hypothetical protein [Cyclobacteriaceae bacterium]
MRYFARLKFSLFTLLLFFLLFDGKSQSVSGVQVQIVEDNLEIVYRMINLKPGQKFRARLYSSIDNYAKPLETGITGAVGEDLSLKDANRIVLEKPLINLGPVTSDIFFRVRVTLTYFPITVITPSDYFSQKRGRKFTTTWEGGLPMETINFDIYRNESLIRDNAFSTANTNTLTVKMPKDLELGGGYQIKMEAASLESPVDIHDFQIKRRTSIFGKIVRLALLTAAVDYALGDQGFFMYNLIYGPGPGQESTPLPDPPFPTIYFKK